MRWPVLRTLLLEETEEILRIVLHRPEKMNALNAEMYSELHATLDHLEKESSHIRVLIFTGAGEAFCAGGDVMELQAASATVKTIQQRLRLSHGLVGRVRNLRQPVIMAVNGPAVGAGLSLALSGDLIIASETARLGASFLKVGLLPDLGAIHTLVHRLGTSRACELCFLAEMMDAREAERVGLVNQVVEKAKLDEVVFELARRMAGFPALQLALLKKAIYKAQEISFWAELEDEINLQSLCLLSEEGREGLRAFLEKRKPVFKG